MEDFITRYIFLGCYCRWKDITLTEKDIGVNRDIFIKGNYNSEGFLLVFDDLEELRKEFPEGDYQEILIKKWEGYKE